MERTRRFTQKDISRMIPWVLKVEKRFRNIFNTAAESGSNEAADDRCGGCCCNCPLSAPKCSKGRGQQDAAGKEGAGCDSKYSEEEKS